MLFARFAIGERGACAGCWGWSSWVSETDPPGTVEIVAVKVFRNDQPENNSCKDSTLLQIDVAATDNRTPATELGYRLRVVTGTTPPPGLGDDRDRDRSGGQLLVSFSGACSDLDFELGISAIDQSGNVGPETVLPIFDEAPQGCNGGGSWSLVPGLALLALRRRRTTGAR